MIRTLIRQIFEHAYDKHFRPLGYSVSEAKNIIEETLKKGKKRKMKGHSSKIMWDMWIIIINHNDPYSSTCYGADYFKSRNQVIERFEKLLV